MDILDDKPLSKIKLLKVRDTFSIARMMLIDHTLEQIRYSSSRKQSSTQTSSSSMSTDKITLPDAPSSTANIEISSIPRVINAETQTIRDCDDEQRARSVSIQADSTTEPVDEKKPSSQPLLKKSMSRIMLSVPYKDKHQLNTHIEAFIRSQQHPTKDNSSILDAEFKRPEVMKQMEDYRQSTAIEDEQWKKLSELHDFRTQLMARTGLLPIPAAKDERIIQ